MKRWGYWIIVGAVLLAAVALIGWARAYIPLRTPRASEEWSRGRLLGVTPVNIRVDLQAAPDGGVFLSWVDLDDRLRVVRVGARGQVVADRAPASGAHVPREPHLLVGPEGEIHLIWRETGERRSLLTYARLDSAASVQVGPFPLSLAGDEAQSPHLAFNRQGGVEVFWTGQAGIYWATLSAEGEMQGEPVLLVKDGGDVSVQMDHEGIFHLAWLQEIDQNVEVVYYASLNPEHKDLSQPEEMTRLFLRVGQSVESLVIGLDTDIGYILWAIQDMKYVTSSAQYAFFPLEIPRQKKVRDLQLDAGGNPLSLWAAPGQYEKLLVALAETVMTPDGPGLQIGVITLRGEQSSGDYVWAAVGTRLSTDSRLAGLRLGDSADHGRPVTGVPWWYRDQGEGHIRWVQIASPIALHVYANNPQLAIRYSPFVQSDWPEDQVVVTASGSPSLKPSLAVDAQDNLHLSWLETGGFGAYRVAYASTTSEVKQAYNRLTVWDVTDRVMGMAMQFFLAVGLTPVLAIYWSLFPLMWLLLYLLFTGHESLTVSGARVAFGVSVLLEVISTYLVYPHRSRMSPVLQWTVPLATAAVALLLALLYLRKRDEKPLFGAFFVFAIANGLLQVMCFVLVR